MAAKQKQAKPKWESDEEYFNWARGEARAIIRPVDFPARNEAGSQRVVDAYHGEVMEDDG